MKWQDKNTIHITVQFVGTLKTHAYSVHNDFLPKSTIREGRISAFTLETPDKHYLELGDTGQHQE